MATTVAAIILCPTKVLLLLVLFLPVTFLAQVTKLIILLIEPFDCLQDGEMSQNLHLYVRMVSYY